jgi:hypothetical protein
MKTLKLSVFIFVLGFGFTQFAGAVEAGAAPPTILEATNSATAGANLGEVTGTIADGEDQIKEGVRDTVFESAYEKAGQEAQQDLDRLEPLVGAASSSVEALAKAVQALGKAANSCKEYTEIGSDCCMNPKNCGGTAESAAGQADQAAGQASQQAQQAAGGGGGGGGAAAQCLSALPGLMAMTGKSRGAGLACGLIRDGNGEKRGCKKTCQDVGRAAQAITNAASGMPSRFPQQVSVISSFRDQAKEHIETASKSAKECSTDTNKGQAAANAQAASGNNAMQGLMGCLQALMSGEETQEEGLEDEEAPQVAVNCASIAERSANPDQCIGYSGGDGFGDGNLSKTSGSNLSLESGDPSSDLPDAIAGDGDGAVNGTPAAAALGESGMKTTNPALAALAGMNGAGGTNNKTGGRGKKKEGKDLIGGYKNVKGGAGGYSRGPASKGFKPFSFGKKKVAAKDKKALAALSQLMKAGISPDQTGSIFERASKRFASSSSKEKLYDARRNRSLWMEKRR